MDTEVISPVRQDFSAPPWLGHIVLPRSVISSFCTCHSIINSFSDHYLNNSCTHSTQTYNIDLPLVINIHSEFQYCSGAMIFDRVVPLTLCKKNMKKSLFDHFTNHRCTNSAQIWYIDLHVSYKYTHPCKCYYHWNFRPRSFICPFQFGSKNRASCFLFPRIYVLVVKRKSRL